MRISDWSSDVCSSDLNHNGQSATVPVNGPWPGGGTMLGGTASLPAGDGSWAEVMVEWHPVIATAASAAASTGSRSLRRSEEHTSELQSLMRNSYAVFYLKKKMKYRINQ